MLMSQPVTKAGTVEVCLTVVSLGECVVESLLGRCAATLIRYKRASTVLIPLEEEQRRIDQEVSDVIAHRFSTTFINPDEPFRYLPPEQPELTEKVEAIEKKYRGAARIHTVVKRRRSPRWGRR